MKTNVLYYGDNLEVMHKHIPDNSVDLIYIDPPFFSSKAYEIIYGDTKEKRMFEDRWKGDVYHYVNWMEPRLAQMHRVLKPTGSIYVHLDWHAVHYIKIAMDRIFGDDNFRNDIIWHYTGRRMKGRNKFNAKHDTILFYGKSNQAKIRNYPTERYTREDYIKMKKQEVHKDEDGREWIWGHAGKGKSHHYRIYIDEVTKKGRAIDDVWDIPIINTSAKERLGYPTQKPEELLKQIIEASSNPNEIVADFFCGCGTTLAVAQLLRRKWIGCDVAPTALRLVKQRLIKYGATEIEEVDVPKSLEDLKAMKALEFQNYIVSFIQGTHSPTLVADFGIDGYTTFKRYPVQVKQQEHVGRPEIQKFQSAIHAEKKDKGYFFAFSFTKPAYEEAARCKQEEGIEIELWQVQDLMVADPPPTFL